MKPDKLETEFRNKLNQREIDPSAKAWDRLDAMLTIAEEKKPKRSYGWLYIAASFIGFLLIGTILFSQTEELIDLKRNEVVIENKVEREPTIDKTGGIIPAHRESEGLAKVSEKNNLKINHPETELIIKENSPIKDNQIAEQSIINQKNEQSNSVNQDNATTDERLTSVTALPKNEITKGSVKVDANNLLSQVDGELELSFREKVIKTVDKNYKTVKVALSTRNQE